MIIQKYTFLGHSVALAEVKDVFYVMVDNKPWHMSDDNLDHLIHRVQSRLILNIQRDRKAA